MEFRTFELDATRADDENQVVPAVLSTDAPVAMPHGREVLSHEPDAVDLSRAPLPVVEAHNARAPNIALAENVRLEGGRLRADIRFGVSQRARELYQDVVKGIVRNLSVGYRILTQPETREGVSYVSRWSPHEVSIVGAPADADAGFYRSDEVTEMTEQTHDEVRAVAAPDPEFLDDVRAEGASHAIADERTRAKHIMTLARQHQAKELGAEYVENGRSVNEFREALDKLYHERDVAAKVPAIGANDIGLTQKEIRQYSFCRAILATIPPTDAHARRYQEAAAFELECSQAAADMQNRDTTPKGLAIPENPQFFPGDTEYGRELNKRAIAGEPTPRAIVPPEVYRHNALGERAPLEVGTPLAAGNLVQTSLLSASFIDILRNRSLVLNPNVMNATFLRDLRDNIDIPRKITSTGFGWAANEGDDAPEATIEVDLVQFRPKDAGVYKDYTRRLLLQSSIDIEQMVRTDLADQAAVGVDLAAFYGTGTLGQPLGVGNTPGIGAVTLATPAQPTFPEMIEMETGVEVANALQGSLAYATEPNIRGHAKGLFIDPGSGIRLWNGGVSGDMNGYAAHSSNQITAGDVLFGNWRDLAVAMWGGVDLLVDPFSLSLSGTLRVVLWTTVDVQLLRLESFVKAQ